MLRGYLQSHLQSVGHVEGMISVEKEMVKFLKKIDVNEGDKKGNVEKWMLEIED